MVNIDLVKKLRSEQGQTIISSNLPCFVAHRGFRPGEVHTLVGPRGGGKSTMAKTIITDCISLNKKVLVLLSEEKAEKYIIPIYQSLLLANKTSEEIQQSLSLIKIVSELDVQNISSKFWKEIEYDIDDFAPDLFIYDNFTTGFMAALAPDRQYTAMCYIRSLAEKKNIPILVYLHTDKKSRPQEKRLTSEDVKGLSTIVNLASYNYVLQQVFLEEKRLSFLIIDKSRYHPEADKTIWELSYHKACGIYVKAEKVSQEDFMSLFQKKKKSKQEEF